MILLNGKKNIYKILKENKIFGFIIKNEEEEKYLYEKILIFFNNPDFNKKSLSVFVKDYNFFDKLDFEFSKEYGKIKEFILK